MKKITIRPPYIKLSALLKYAGSVSGGGEADILIKEGRVKVNGEICLQRGKKLRGGDKVGLPGGEELVVEEGV